MVAVSDDVLKASAHAHANHVMATGQTYVLPRKHEKKRAARNDMAAKTLVGEGLRFFGQADVANEVSHE